MTIRRAVWIAIAIAATLAAYLALVKRIPEKEQYHPFTATRRPLNSDHAGLTHAVPISDSPECTMPPGAGLSRNYHAPKLVFVQYVQQDEEESDENKKTGEKAQNPKSGQLQTYTNEPGHTSSNGPSRNGQPQTLAGGKSSGDVHIKMLNGVRYDFQGVGEFVALQDQSASVKIQVRQQPFGNSKTVSVATALAMNVAGDVVGVYAGLPVPVRVNHQPVLSQDAVLALPHGGEIQRQTDGFLVVWPTKSRVRVLWGSYLDYLVTLCPSDQTRTEGLLGDPDTPENSLTTRRGNTVPLSGLAADALYHELYRDFGDSWRIAQRESLFDYEKGQSTKTFTDSNFPYQPDPAAGLTQAQRQSAENVCRRAGISDPASLRECILDVAITGESEFATNDALTEAMYAKSGNRLVPASSATRDEGVPCVDCITNGDFEQVQIDSFSSSDPAAVPGWTHSGAVGEGPLWAIGYSDGGGSVATAGNGRQFTTLGGGYGVSGTATWQTTIRHLIPGRTHILSFLMASETNQFGQSVTVTLSNGASASQTFSAPPSSAPYWRDWVSRELQFTPTAANATVTFSATTSQDVGIDSIVIKRRPDITDEKYPSLPGRSEQNLLKNGSFEDGPDPGGFVTLQPGSTVIRDWVVTRASIDYIGSHFPSAEGRRHIDLDGSPGFGGIQQTFATVPGRKYRVTFDLAGNPDCPPTIKRMGVHAAGQSAEFAHDASLNWTAKTWDFTANRDHTAIEFYSMDKENGECGPLLDNVSVAESK